MTVYDPRGMAWDQWCKLVVEMFSELQLTPVTEDQWPAWVDNLSGIAYFSAFGVPRSAGFRSWGEWASAFVGVMNLD